MIDDFEADKFRSFLLTGERVLWSGKPKQGLVFRWMDVFLIPFSLMWGGFTIFWNIGVWFLPETDGEAPWFFRLWGLPFLLIGLYIMVGRFWHDATLRKRLAYAVTNQRVLVLRGSNISSLDISRLPKIELTEFKDGSGTIEFEGSSVFSSFSANGFGGWVPALDKTMKFFRIANPRQAYDTIVMQTRG